MTHRAVLILALLAPALAVGAPPPPAAPATTSPPAARPTPKPVVAPVLEGTVKGPDAKPIEGALVLCRSLDASAIEMPRTARTDASGRFRVEMNQLGLVAVRIEAAGFAARIHEKVDPRLPLAARLERGGVITGIVQDERGRPVSQAQVEASSGFTFVRSPWEDGGQIRALTDAQGRFRLEGVASGLYAITARARGLGSASQADVVAGGKVKLLLRAGGLVAGVVTDAEGRAVEHALVRAEMEGRAWKTSRDERSDRQGRFELLGLESGSYTVTARHPDFASAVATGVRVEKEGTTEATLALSPGATVIGRLLGPEERPAAGRVFIQELGGLRLPRLALGPPPHGGRLPWTLPARSRAGRLLGTRGHGPGIRGAARGGRGLDQGTRARSGRHQPRSRPDHPWSGAHHGRPAGRECADHCVPERSAPSWRQGRGEVGSRRHVHARRAAPEPL